MVSWDALVHALPVVEEGDPSPLLSTGEAISGVLGSVLGFPGQEGQGATGEKPTRGQEGDEGTGTSLP